MSGISEAHENTPLSQEDEEVKRERERSHENDVQLGPLAKDGEKLMQSLMDGNMVGILSGNEVMYTLKEASFKCYIHPLGAEEGRAKMFPNNEKTRAIIKNMANICDQLFEIKFREGMDVMGVMVAAEQGIINFLDMIGKLPADDFDFMEGYENPQ